MLEIPHRLRRANPVWFECRSWIGDWQTDDRVTWRTTDGVWLPQLQRSPNGRRVFLRLWRGQTFVGYQDAAGWHPRCSQEPVATAPPGPTLAAAAAGWLAFMASSNFRNGSHDQSLPTPLLRPYRRPQRLYVELKVKMRVFDGHRLDWGLAEPRQQGSPATSAGFLSSLVGDEMSRDVGEL